MLACVMSRRRALDWVLIVVLTGSWAVLFANAVGEGLRTGRGRVLVGVTSAAASDVYPTVRWSDWTELQRGDRIEAVDGEDLVGAPALRFYDLATRGARERGFAIVRADRAGAPFDVRIELTGAVLRIARVGTRGAAHRRAPPRPCTRLAPRPAQPQASGASRQLSPSPTETPATTVRNTPVVLMEIYVGSD
jgi:hypothetical protein